jgi:hypothetical protein
VVTGTVDVAARIVDVAADDADDVSADASDVDDIEVEVTLAI